MTKTVAKQEKHQFQTEVNQLLQLMIHSLYSNKEIFLRELISNASDACDKLRFASLTDKSLMENGEALGVWIQSDEKNKKIIIRDNGIGMTREEVIENIGTIARSGTKKFMEQIEKSKEKETQFIGQFGVGFYSCFLVAEKVVLSTRKAGDDANAGTRWISDGSGEYLLESAEGVERGTQIELTLKKEDKEYSEKYRLRGIASKYSNHITLPIHMLEEVQVAADDDDEKDNGEDKKTSKTTLEWKPVNDGTALWARPKREIKQEEYNSFYATLSYDGSPPAVTLHNRVEGSMDYISLFFIPEKAPFDLWDRERRHGIKLYVRRVFISDDTKQLLPNYLRFVRGLIDSMDLPLNVSREFLQHNKKIDKIRAASIKKILTELEKISQKDTEKYQKLWGEYGKVLKEGIVEDLDNKDAIAKLLRFASTHSDSETQAVSFADYIARMPEKQKHIYYVTADSYTAAKSSPHLEIFKKNDLEVLLLSDPVDEWLVMHLHEYEGKTLQSVSKGELDLGEMGGKDEQESKQDSSDETKGFVEEIKKTLGDQVKEVRVSSRLVDSPCCLVTDSNDLGGNMERILQSMGQSAPASKPILEINSDHELIKKVRESEKASDWAQLLYDQALLSEGGSLKDPGAFVRNVNRLLLL